MVRQESLEFKVFQEDQDLWEVPEIKDQWEIKVRKDPQESLGLLAQEEIQAKTELQEFLVHQDKLDQLVKEALLVPPDQEVFKECRDHLAKMVSLVEMELLECRDHQV